MTTRDKILDAAADVIARLGLARSTTKEIARAAGYSEATIYKHFRDKDELITQVQLERMPDFFALVQGLPGRAGQATVIANLVDFTITALDHYYATFPMAAALFAEPHLLAAQRHALRQVRGGPQLANQGLADYLRKEQTLGRLNATLSPEAASALLIGACFQQAFLDHFNEHAPDGHQRTALAAELVDALLKQNM